MKNTDYIHPNFTPKDPTEYLELVNRLRKEAKYDVDVLYVTQQEYDILEDAAHETMKGVGHCVYGVPVEIKIEL